MPKVLWRGPAMAFKNGSAIKPRQRVVAIGVATELAQMTKGEKWACCPFPDITVMEVGLVRRPFPFGFGGQSASLPVAPGLRFKITEVAGGIL